MAKFGKLSEENMELVRTISEDLGLYNFMNIEGISCAKAKEVVKVQKESVVTEYKTSRPGTVNVFIYEKAFDMLDDTQKDLLLRDAFNAVNFDSEKDKIMIGCPQIVVSLDGRVKWGDELLNAAEAGVLAIQQIEEQEKEEKEKEKAERAAKRQKRNG